MPKSKGAQPGNTNAIRHGYYSPRFNQPDPNLSPLREEEEENKSLSEPTLTREIIMLRRLIDTIIHHIEKDQLSLELKLTALSTLSHAVVSLAHLFRTQAALTRTQTDQIEAALQAALQELTQK